MKLLWLKAWRDLRKHFSAFLACILMMGLAIALLVGFSSAYVNLGQSADFTYKRLNFLDASLQLRSSPPSLVDRAQAMPNVAAAEVRCAAGVRILLRDGEKVRGTVVGMPTDRRVSVNDLLIHRGGPIRSVRGECLLERRFAELHGYPVGSLIEVEKGRDRRRLHVVGLITSPEYLWLTPDRLDPRPAARRFGVIFASHEEVASLTGSPAVTELYVRWKPGSDPAQGLRDLERIFEGQREGPARPRSQQASHSLLERDRVAFAGIAAIFPLALLSLASLMLFLTLWQLIHQQRKQIGILLCQGLPPRWIASHYLALSLWVALASCLLGSVLGPWLGHLATSYYVTTLGLPFQRETLHFPTLFLGWTVAIALALVAAAAALRHLFQTQPLQLLRAEFSAQASMPGFLRFLPVGLGFRWLFPLRNLLRQPWRSLTMVAGVAMSNALLLMTLAMFDSQQSTLNFYLTQVHRYDLQADLDLYSVRSDRPAVELWPGVERVEEVLRLTGSLFHDGQQLERALWGLRPDTQLLRLYDQQLKPLAPGPGVLLSPLQRRQLHLQPGNEPEFEVFTGERRPLRQRVALGPALYEPIQGPPKIDLRSAQDLLVRTQKVPREVCNVLLIKVKPGQLGQIRQRLFQDKRVREVITLAQYREDVKDLLRLMVAYFSLMLGCAGLISLALVHACTTMNLSERRAEVACMLVQGVRSRDLFQLLLGEALYLWLIGMLLGVPAGYAAGDWLLGHYQSDLIDLRLQLLPRTVAWTALASLAVTLLASLRAILGLLKIPLAEATRSPD